MPCFTVRTVSVNLEAANYGLLKSGLLAAGYSVVETGERQLSIAKGGRRATIRNGQVVAVEGVAEALAADIKQAYAKEAVRTAARRFGWSMVQDRSNPQHVTLQRRQ